MDHTNCLCTFLYRGEYYAIVLMDEIDSIRCVHLEWDPWHGYRYCEDVWVAEDVWKMGDRLASLSEDAPRKYPMHGEHYIVTVLSEGETVRYRIRKERSLFSPFSKQTVSLFLKFAVQLLFTLAVVILFAETGIGWISALFPKASEFTSFCVYYSIEIIGSILLFIYFKDARDLLSLCFYAYIPIGLIVLIGMSSRWKAGFLIPVGLLLLFGILILNILRTKKHTELYQMTIKKASLRLKTCMIFMAVLSLCVMWFFQIYPYAYATEEADIGGEASILEERFLDACEMLEQERFCELETEERLTVLQAICDYECIVGFGCNSAKLQTLYIKDEGTLGYYTNAEQTITIDLTLLKGNDPEKIVSTVLHEVRHHYQHRLVDLYQTVKPNLNENNQNMEPFRDARKFLINFQDYQDNKKDGYDAYYQQLVEQDSRAFAEKRMQEYYLSLIN
ncbi:MAG: hypothetical protein IJ489_07470 [Clostridia bacterium]|nr:hypothetical protein [Clostridia bacterium]